MQCSAIEWNVIKCGVKHCTDLFQAFCNIYGCMMHDMHFLNRYFARHEPICHEHPTPPVFRGAMIVKNGEWPWPFTKMQKSDSTNGQFQKMAIRLFWPFVSPNRENHGHVSTLNSI